jgi:hypothetical protein
MNFKEYLILERMTGTIGDLGHITTDIQGAIEDVSKVNQWFSEHMKADPKLQRIAQEVSRKKEALGRSIDMEKNRHAKRIEQLKVQTERAQNPNVKGAISNQIKTENDIHQKNINRMVAQYKQYSETIKKRAYSEYVRNKSKGKSNEKETIQNKRQETTTQKTGKKDTGEKNSREKDNRNTDTGEETNTSTENPQYPKDKNDKTAIIKYHNAWIKILQERLRNAKKPTEKKDIEDELIEHGRGIKNVMAVTKKPYLKNEGKGQPLKPGEKIEPREEIKPQYKFSKGAEYDAQELLRKRKLAQQTKEKEKFKKSWEQKDKEREEARKKQGITSSSVPHPWLEGKIVGKNADKEGKEYNYDDDTKTYVPIEKNKETKTSTYGNFQPKTHVTKASMKKEKENPEAPEVIPNRPKNVPASVGEMDHNHIKTMLTHYNQALSKAMKSGDNNKIKAIKDAVIVMKRAQERKNREKKLGTTPLKGKTIPVENKKQLQGKSIVKTNKVIPQKKPLAEKIIPKVNKDKLKNKQFMKENVLTNKIEILLLDTALQKVEQMIYD